MNGSAADVPATAAAVTAAAAANQNFNLSSIVSAISIFRGLATMPPAAAAVELEPATAELEPSTELELEPEPAADAGLEAAVLAPPWLGWSVTDDSVMGGVSAGTVREQVTRTDANLAGLYYVTPPVPLPLPTQLSQPGQNW